MKNKWMVSMPWNIDKRLFKLELSFEKKRLAELHFLIPVIDQKRSSANRQNDPQKEVNYNKPLMVLVIKSPLSEKSLPLSSTMMRSREVYADFADSFHTEFFEIDHFDRF